MAWPVYTRELIRARLPAAGDYAEYTVPSGRIVVARDLMVFAGGDSGSKVRLKCVVCAVILYETPTLADDEAFHLDFRQAFPAGETLQLEAEDGACYVSLTGYVLTASA